MILFLDANIIIYQVEAASPFREQVRITLDNLLHTYPDACFAVSRLSLLECLVKPLREHNTPLVDRYRMFFNSSDLLIVDLDATVVETALQLRAHHGLRTPDALQAASCLTLPQPTIFITGDKSFASIPELTLRSV